MEAVSNQMKMTTAILLLEDSVARTSVHAIARQTACSLGLTDLTLIDCFYEQFADSRFFEEALQTAVEAELVIVAASSSRPLSGPALSWFFKWVCDANKRSSLIVLSPSAETNAPQLHAQLIPVAQSLSISCFPGTFASACPARNNKNE